MRSRYNSVEPSVRIKKRKDNKIRNKFKKKYVWSWKKKKKKTKVIKIEIEIKSIKLEKGKQNRIKTE